MTSFLQWVVIDLTVHQFPVMKKFRYNKRGKTQNESSGVGEQVTQLEDLDAGLPKVGGQSTSYWPWRDESHAHGPLSPPLCHATPTHNKVEVIHPQCVWPKRIWSFVCVGGDKMSSKTLISCAGAPFISCAGAAAKQDSMAIQENHFPLNNRHCPPQAPWKNRRWARWRSDRSGFSLESPGEPWMCRCGGLERGEGGSGALEVIQANARCLGTPDSRERLFLCCLVVLCCLPPLRALGHPSNAAYLGITAATAWDFSRNTQTTCIKRAA